MSPEYQMRWVRAVRAALAHKPVQALSIPKGDVLTGDDDAWFDSLDRSPGGRIRWGKLNVFERRRAGKIVKRRSNQRHKAKKT